MVITKGFEGEFDDISLSSFALQESNKRAANNGPVDLKNLLIINDPNLFYIFKHNAKAIYFIWLVCLNLNILVIIYLR